MTYSFADAELPGDQREVLSMRPVFMPQKGKLGYARRLLYHFVDRGGYVAMAKRYRLYAGEKGLVKTLAEKRKERPAIDRLVGAVNIYGNDFRNIEELKKLGIERAPGVRLHQRQGPPAERLGIPGQPLRHLY